MKYRVQFMMGGDLTGGVWSKPYEVEANDRTGAILAALCEFPPDEQERLRPASGPGQHNGVRAWLVGEEVAEQKWRGPAFNRPKGR